MPRREFLALKNKCIIYNWGFQYKEIILNPERSYFIKGFYQSYKYSDMQLFEPLIQFDAVQLNVKPSDIAIHISRKDYLTSPIHKSMSLDYYYNGIQYILNKIGNNIDFDIYIFSDDIGWCKKISGIMTAHLNSLV